MAGGALLVSEGWNWVGIKVPSFPSHSVILRPAPEQGVGLCVCSQAPPSCASAPRSPSNSSGSRTKAGVSQPSALVPPRLPKPPWVPAKQTQAGSHHPPSRRRGSPALPSAAPPPRAAAPSRRPPLLLGKNEASSSPARPLSEKTRNRAGGSRRRPPPSHPMPCHPPHAILSISPHPTLWHPPHPTPPSPGLRQQDALVPHPVPPALTARWLQQQREGDAAEQPPASHDSGQEQLPSRPAYKSCRRSFPLPPPALQPALQPPAWGWGCCCRRVSPPPLLPPARLGDAPRVPVGGALGVPLRQALCQHSKLTASKGGETCWIKQTNMC